MTQSKKYTYIDLFSGAGGMSLGFQNAGFKNVFSVDNNPSFCDTYKNNFKNHNLIIDDIGNLKKTELLKYTKKIDIDVIIGGPPCQGFSIAGNIGRKFIDDPRNHLFKEFSRIVGILKPKIFVMENVAKLYIHNKGKTRGEIINEFQKIGYNVDVNILHSENYGIPQKRARVFFIGNRIGKKNLFPTKYTKLTKTVRDAIDDLPILTSGQTSDMPNHTAMNHSEQMLIKMGYVKDGGNRLDIPIALRPKSGDARKYIRYESNSPSICITGDMRKVFHYKQNRALTVRELARIQTFPDLFVFKGSKISQQQQVGNSVPPLLANIVAKEIRKML